MNKKVFLPLVTSFAVVLAAFYIAYKNASPEVIKETENKISNLIKDEPTPTPFPFMDLTIPYLRSRSYESSLSGLEKLSENSKYTSYRASYLSDGYKVYGFLTIPNPSTSSGQEAEKVKYPAIVFVHGYIAPTIYKTERNYASYVDFFANRGYVVFKIDLRGHDRSEGEAHGAYYSGDYVVDTLSAFDALQNSEFVDPNRIGLWGHSMAGNITFRSFAAKKDISAVVIWAGAGYTYEDLSQFGIDDNSYRPPDQNSERARRRKELADKYGPFDTGSWFWKQVPATNYLEGVSGAVQLNHAIDDNVVSVEYSRNLAKILENKKIEYELNEYSSGGHNITGSNFSAAMNDSVNFFDKHLGKM